MPNGEALTPDIANEFELPPAIGAALSQPPGPLVPDIANEFELPPAIGRLAQAPGQVQPAGAALPPSIGAALPPSIGGVQLARPEDIAIDEDPAAGLETLPPAITPGLIAPPPATEAQRLGGVVAQSAANLDRQRRQIANLDQRADQLRRQVMAETDSAKRAELIGRLEQVAGASEGVRQEQTQTRIDVEEQGAGLTAAAQVEQQGIQAAAVDELARRRKTLADETASKLAASEAEEATLRAQLVEDRREYKAFLSAGAGESNIGQAMVDIFAETLRAQSQRRVPNYSQAINQANQRNAAQFERTAKARMEVIEITTDEIGDSQRLQAETRAQEAASAAAIAAEIEEKLTGDLGRATEPLERARLSLSLENVRTEREQREVAARQARADADRKLRKEQADVALVEAKTGKELALGEKARADAAKAARRGRGGRARDPMAGLIAPNIVAVPGTDATLVEFPDDAKGRKEAQVTRDIVGEQQSFLETMNSIEAFYEDAEGQGLISSIGIQGSDANQRLGVLIGVAKAKLAQIKAGPGKATTNADEEWAEDFVPENPKAWTNRDRGLKRLKAATGVFEDESRSILQRSTRLNTSTRERLVREARKRGVSRTQRSRLEASRAAETVVDKKATQAARIKAVELVEENARAEAGDNWLRSATEQTAALLDKVDDPQVTEALTKNLNKFRRLSRTRVEKLKVALPHLNDKPVRDPDTGLPTGEIREAKGLAQNQTVVDERATQKIIEKAARRRVRRDVSKLQSQVGTSVLGLLGLNGDEDDNAER